MTPKPSLADFDLAVREIEARHARTLSVLRAYSYALPTGIVQALTADFYAQIKDLKEGFAEDARRAQPHSAEAGADFSWPVVSRRDGNVIPFRRPQ